MMHRHVDRYINLHRALGKGFAKQEKSLREFAAFAADRSNQQVTAALILEWAGSAATPNSAQDRYDQARAFAMFLHVRRRMIWNRRPNSGADRSGSSGLGYAA